MEKHFAVIGDPIAHSLSPLMHEAGYKALGIVAEYQRFRVESRHLKEAVKGLYALGFSGWNVTLPHKESIVTYLDELTPEAQTAGAVNTVKVTKGKLIGHNTDGLGFVRSIEHEFKDLRGKKAVILGAGGAAKGIALALTARGANLHILNRTVAKAEKLAEAVRVAGGEATSGVLAPGEWLYSLDLLVQTTSIGLQGEAFPFSLQGIVPHALVVDIIFKPWETPFLQDAQAQGCRTLNGLGMLLHQGALAWELWFGQKAPVEAMQEALLRAVKAG